MALPRTMFEFDDLAEYVRTYDAKNLLGLKELHLKQHTTLCLVATNGIT